MATAAEAIAAAQFARLGYDVSVQYGANQPEYDLMIDDRKQTLKVSVKGSQDGSWGLTQSHLKKGGKANYHGAIAAWLGRHSPYTIICLVQFKGALLSEMPRIYLATPTEIADRMFQSAGGRGDTILYEDHTRGPKAAGAGTNEHLPDIWRLSKNRIDDLLTTITAREVPGTDSH